MSKQPPQGTKHVGNFTRGGNYGAEFELSDGTRANVVTIYGTPGLASDTAWTEGRIGDVEVEADRPLTIDELESLMDADSAIDHTQEPQITYTDRPLRRHY